MFLDGLFWWYVGLKFGLSSRRNDSALTPFISIGGARNDYDITSEATESQQNMYKAQRRSMWFFLVIAVWIVSAFFLYWIKCYDSNFVWMVLIVVVFYVLVCCFGYWIWYTQSYFNFNGIAGVAVLGFDFRLPEESVETHNMKCAHVAIWLQSGFDLQEYYWEFVGSCFTVVVIGIGAFLSLAAILTLDDAEWYCLALLSLIGVLGDVFYAYLVLSYLFRSSVFFSAVLKHYRGEKAAWGFSNKSDPLKNMMNKMVLKPSAADIRDMTEYGFFVKVLKHYGFLSWTPLYILVLCAVHVAGVIVVIIWDFVVAGEDNDLLALYFVVKSLLYSIFSCYAGWMFREQLEYFSGQFYQKKEDREQTRKLVKFGRIDALAAASMITVALGAEVTALFALAFKAKIDKHV